MKKAFVVTLFISIFCTGCSFKDTFLFKSKDFPASTEISNESSSSYSSLDMFIEYEPLQENFADDNTQIKQIYIPSAQSIENKIKQDIENAYKIDIDTENNAESAPKEKISIYFVYFHEKGRNDKTWNASKIFYNKKEISKDVLRFPHLEDEFTMNDTDYIIVEKEDPLKVDIAQANDYIDKSYIKENYDYIKVTEYIALKKD